MGRGHDPAEQGYCPCCKEWVISADAVLGLEAHTQNSPDWAEKMAYLATKVPPVEAAEILEHLTGEEAAPSRTERLGPKPPPRRLGPETRVDFRLAFVGAPPALQHITAYFLASTTLSSPPNPTASE